MVNFESCFSVHILELYDLDLVVHAALLTDPTTPKL
jgi:hypothetical protein